MSPRYREETGIQEGLGSPLRSCSTAAGEPRQRPKGTELSNKGRLSTPLGSETMDVGKDWSTCSPVGVPLTPYQSLCEVKTLLLVMLRCYLTSFHSLTSGQWSFPEATCRMISQQTEPQSRCQNWAVSYNARHC